MNAGSEHCHHPADAHHHPGGHRGWVRANGRRGRWLEPFRDEWIGVMRERARLIDAFLEGTERMD